MKTMACLVVMMTACGAPAKSEWAGTWVGSKLTTTQKCADPSTASEEIAPRDVRLAMLELGPNVENPELFDLRVAVDVDGAPSLQVDALDRLNRVVMPQGDPAFTSGVRWLVEGGNVGDRTADAAQLNNLVLSFDDVGSGARCRYGIWTISGPVTRIPRDAP